MRGARKALSLSVGLVTVLVLTTLVTPQAALANSCPGDISIGFLNEHWKPDAQIAGFRAPLVFRKSGSVCTPGGFSATWVGIEAGGATGTGHGISQMGFLHEPGSYCRFWEWNDNSGYDTQPQLAHCGDDQDGDSLNFKIAKLWQPRFNFYSLAIYNCGTSGWTNTDCNLVSDGPDADTFGNMIGATDAEVHYSCTDNILGSQNAQSKWGGNDPIEGMPFVNGSYDVKTLTYHDTSGCSEYVSSTHTNDTFKVYDSNN
jgi:hypothetical protein